MCPALPSCMGKILGRGSVLPLRGLGGKFNNNGSESRLH
jgi:hypothetical protein